MLHPAVVIVSGGGKARNLGRLAELGFPVPPFYVIDAHALDDVSEALAQWHEWQKHQTANAVAVRSSADAEDGETKSFAGQFASVMPVRTDQQFVDALQTVAASAPDAAYSTTRVAVHAVVQAFVDADVAGVCFTVDPSTGQDTLVINAAYGLGANVVNGHESAKYSVDRWNLRSSETHEPAHQRNVLSTQQRELLVRTALRIERAFGSPQDIEWAFVGDELFILQSRSITRINHLQVWDSSNISESFPGTVSPLTFSIARRGYFLAYASQARASGMGWVELQRYNSIFDSMLAMFNGKIYYNLSSWYRFIGLFPGNNKNQKYLDDQIQTLGTSAYLPKAKHGRAYTLRFWLFTAVRVLRFGGNQRRFRERLHSQFEHVRNMAPGSGAFALYERYEYLEQEAMPHMGRSVDNDVFVMLYNGWLTGCLSRWLPDEPDATRIALSDVRDVVSADQALQLYEIARLVKADPELLSALQSGPADDFRAMTVDAPIAELIARYRSTFGHRFAEDQKIESHNPLLEDAQLFRLIATYTQLDIEDVKRRIRSASEEAAKEVTLLAKQLRPHRRIIFNLLRSRLKKHLRIREENRLLRSKVFAECREVFGEMGRTFVNTGVIDEADDIYQLEVDDIEGFLRGKSTTVSLRGLIAVRRSGVGPRAGMPDRFVTTGYPYEDVKTMPAHIDLTDSALSLPGSISSPGDVSGVVTVLDTPEIPNEPIDILVVSHTDPGWTPLIALANGIIVEHGGLLSHAAIITRELGIPSIIGVDGATEIMKTGMRVNIDTAASAVTIQNG